MSDFKDTVHRIRFRLGLCPRPAGGAYRGLLLTLGSWDENERGEKKGREREGGGKGMNPILGLVAFVGSCTVRLRLKAMA